MDPKDLHKHELAALIALLQRIVVMDSKISAEERRHVFELSRRFEPEQYREALAHANETLRDDEGLSDLVDGVERPEARAVIYQLVRETAAADEITAHELALLHTIEGRWGLEPT